MRFENRGLLILSGVLCVAIMGLSAGIILNIQNQKSVSYDTSVRKEEILSSIKEDIAKIENPTIEQVINIYQNYIDATDDLEIKVALLEARIFAVQDMDLNNEYGEEVISDAIIVDDLLQTTDSAARVMNVATAYGNDEVFERYGVLLKDRQAEQGVDINMETEG